MGTETDFDGVCVCCIYFEADEQVNTQLLSIKAGCGCRVLLSFCKAKLSSCLRPQYMLQGITFNMKSYRIETCLKLSQNVSPSGGGTIPDPSGDAKGQTWDLLDAVQCAVSIPYR